MTETPAISEAAKKAAIILGFSRRGGVAKRIQRAIDERNEEWVSALVGDSLLMKRIIKTPKDAHIYVQGNEEMFAEQDERIGKLQAENEGLKKENACLKAKAIDWYDSLKGAIKMSERKDRFR